MKSHLVLLMLVTLLVSGCGSPAALAFTRGQFYERLGDVHNERENPLSKKGIWEYKQAIEQYSAAIKLQDKQAESYHRRGICYERIADYASALTDLSQAIALAPTHSNLWRDRAVVYRELDLFDKSVEDYNQVLQQDPKDNFALMARAESLALGGHVAAALADLDAAEQQGKPSASLFCDRAQIYRKAMQVDAMEAAYKKALALDPHNCDTLARRGYSHMIVGDYQKAADDFGAMVQISEYKDRNCGYAVVYRALCLRLLHQDEQCRPWLENAIYQLQLPVASSRTAQDAPLAENWPYPAIQYLNGDISEQAFLQSAGNDQGRTTETQCYVALTHDANGDTATAQRLFKQILAGGKKSFIEYDIAERFAGD